MARKIRILLVASMVTVAGWIPQVLAGTPVYVGSKSVARLVPLDSINHATWHTLLQKYVDQDGMVDYRRLHASRRNVQTLDAYLQHLSHAAVSSRASINAKLSFWINAYNAVTIKGILREYPTSSIRNHTARVFGYNIWKDLKLYVAGTPYSLDQMEHQILRKLNEPRIHFAIVCASKGCPRLLNEAYVPERLEEQLEANARDFFSRQQNFRYDSARKQFQLSELLSWFGADFGATQAAQLKRIAPWLPSAQAQQAARSNAVRVSYLKYDWTLNEQD